MVKMNICSIASVTSQVLGNYVNIGLLIVTK